jgi:hypothetical protein
MPLTLKTVIQNDSKLLSGFPFIGHGDPDNNIESLYLHCYTYNIFRLLSLDYRDISKGQQKLIVTKEKRKGAAKCAVPGGRFFRQCYRAGASELQSQ